MGGSDGLATRSRNCLRVRTRKTAKRKEGGYDKARSDKILPYLTG